MYLQTCQGYTLRRPLMEMWLGKKNKSCCRDTESTQWSGVIKLLFWGDQKMQIYGHFEEFPIQNAFFGLVIHWPWWLNIRVTFTETLRGKWRINKKRFPCPFPGKGRMDGLWYVCSNVHKLHLHDWIHFIQPLGLDGRRHCHHHHHHGGSSGVCFDAVQLLNLIVII